MTLLSETMLRQGDTLALSATAQDDAGDPRDLNGVDATLVLVHRMTGRVESLEASYDGGRGMGQMKFSASATETRTWPPGRWRAWFRFKTGSVIDTTRDFDFTVLEDET